MDGLLIVVGSEFYRIRQCEHIFTPCSFCDLRKSCVFKPKSQWDQDCPFAIRDQYLERCKDITEDMKKGMEQYRKDNPNATWFFLKRNEGRPPQNEQPHNPENMEKTGKTTFKEVADRIVELQSKKNASYGNAFEQSCDKYGVVSALTRLNDKMNRLDALHRCALDGAFGESFTDTLTDLAAYAIMTIQWLENKHNNDLP